MARFAYEGVFSDGKKVKGTVESSSYVNAKEQLDKKGFLLINLKEVKNCRETKLSKEEVITFTKGLSKILKAGLSLYEALNALEEKYRGTHISYIISIVCEKLQSGISFSKALSYHQNSFDLLFCSMIANAEKTGELEKALDEIALLLSKQVKLKKQIVSSLLYPAILSGFCIIVIFTLLFFVVPSLFELFEGRTLHPLTRFVLTISVWVNNKKVLFFSCLLLLISVGIYFVVHPSGRKKIYNIVLHCPYLKTLMLKVALVRFCRSFSILLSGGLSFIDALKLARKGMKHPFLENEITKAEKKVIQGGKLSEQLKQSSIPLLFSRMLAIAEEGGGTEQMLLHLASIYEEEIEKKLAKLTSILQPIVLLILGIVIGFVVLAVLLPLTDVSSFLSDT